MHFLPGSSPLSFSLSLPFSFFLNPSFLGQEIQIPVYSVIGGTVCLRPLLEKEKEKEKEEGEEGENGERENGEKKEKEERREWSEKISLQGLHRRESSLISLSSCSQKFSFISFFPFSLSFLNQNSRTKPFNIIMRIAPKDPDPYSASLLSLSPLEVQNALCAAMAFRLFEEKEEIESGFLLQVSHFCFLSFSYLSSFFLSFLLSPFSFLLSPFSFLLSPFSFLLSPFFLSLQRLIWRVIKDKFCSTN